MRRVPAALDVLHMLRPCRPDVAQNIPYLVIAQRAREGRHPAVEAGYPTRSQGRCSSMFGVVKQQTIVVVPRVPRFVMGRCGEYPVFVRHTPIRLAFEICAMTGGAMRVVEGSAGENVPAVELVRGMAHGCRHGENDHRKPYHSTSTHVFMPDAWCPSMWQCRSHLPGLSKTTAILRDCPRCTRVVSRTSPGDPSSPSSWK